MFFARITPVKQDQQDNSGNNAIPAKYFETVNFY